MDARGCKVLVNHDIVGNAFKLLAALAFVPIMLSVGRNVRVGDARRAFLVGFIAIVVSFALTATDQQVGQSLGAFDLAFRWTRHLTVALGGLAFAWAAWSIRRRELAAPGGQR
jgi:hypothetical protein